MAVRLEPTHCPGCSGPLEAAYSQYRGAKSHPLFTLTILCGVTLTLALLVLGFWGGWELANAGFIPGGGRQRVKERGVFGFLVFVATLPVTAWVTRRWWRYANSLPRTFVNTCPACSWTGPCRVYGTGG